MDKIMIQGRKVIENAICDLESFFMSCVNFNVNVEYNAKNISCKGIGEECRICFSKEFCEFIIRTNDDLHFAILVIGHEMAHYLHRHNEHRDQDSIESRSIEDWADFFGSKIAMTLITFGVKTSNTYLKFIDNKNSGKRLESLGRTLGKLANTYFNMNTECYSNRLSRVGHFVCGINSFLDQYLGNIDINRSFSVMLRIYGDESLKEIMKSESRNFLYEEGNVAIVSNIHKKIQSNDLEITGGLKKEYKTYIGTNYLRSDKDKELYINAVKDIVKMQGLDIDAF